MLSSRHSSGLALFDFPVRLPGIKSFFHLILPLTSSFHSSRRKSSVTDRLSFRQSNCPEVFDDRTFLVIPPLVVSKWDSSDFIERRASHP